MNIDELFDNRTARTKCTQKRTYDVRISLNKKGDHFSIRFGFINESLKAIGNRTYAQVSNVSLCRDKIYFKFWDLKYKKLNKYINSIDKGYCQNGDFKRTEK